MSVREFPAAGETSRSAIDARMIGGSVDVAQRRLAHNGTIIGEPQMGSQTRADRWRRRPVSARTSTVNASVSRADGGVKGKLASLVAGVDP